MKKRIILGFLFLLTAVAFAQNLEEVCASLAEHPNTTGNFVQVKTIQTNGRKLKSNGTYIISTEGILWRTEKPVPSSLILTKNSVVQIAANGKKSVMDGRDNQMFANISETLSSVLSGDAAALRKNFNCDFTINNDGQWSVKLEPKDSTIASVMKTLVLSGTYQQYAIMTSLVMQEASDNEIRYEFLNQKFPKELSADEKQIFVLE